MPYVIKATGQKPRAVATLEEARTHLLDRYGSWWTSGAHESLARDVVTLPGSGGTVGPLPDGTVIEVRRVGLNDLRTGTGTLAMSRDELIADFNAREATTA
jgi:hypothetical protein